jgi:hypothetical protein
MPIPMDGMGERAAKERGQHMQIQRKHLLDGAQKIIFHEQS